MKELLSRYAAFNLWANQKILEAILSLTDEQQQQETPSSFNSLYKTLLHMWSAESVWWQRIKLQERIVFPMETFSGTMADLASQMQGQGQLWVEFVNSSSEAGLQHVFQYYNSKKEYFKQPVYQVLLHVFNHSTYHRGQLVTMMRQLGVEKIPATDFILFERKK